ncbi:metallophosphoesterase [Sporosalibacterium faouarense]|uniref:metallophosphoesterase n=1 Tax=Sporosalibacterium faouarense TaxID=516123 RepID=UPI00141C24BF|nr:metallophosphoesterase [Sporosalibacterium faouarense]MTI46688.1 metallophosphoesterase [Bacillota bacterium]
MKILVLSDTHGNTKFLNKIKERFNNIHMVIHLGDNTKDVEMTRKVFPVDIYNVKGNCDFRDSETPEEQLINIKGKRVFLTHGHNYSVKSHLNTLYYRAKELDAEIALFGHSHVPESINYDGVQLFNPGSPVLPRGGSKKSFGIIDINDEVTFNIYNLK